MKKGKKPKPKIAVFLAEWSKKNRLGVFCGVPVLLTNQFVLIIILDVLVSREFL